MRLEVDAYGKDLIGAVPPPLPLRQGGICYASAMAGSKGDLVLSVSGRTVQWLPSRLS